jgi:hypothetical protein
MSRMAMMFSCLHGSRVASLASERASGKGSKVSAVDGPKVTEELDLSERTETEHGVLEGSDPLDGDFGARVKVDGGDTGGGEKVRERVR